MHYTKEEGVWRCVVELAQKFLKYDNTEIHVFAASFKNYSDERIIFHRVPIIKGHVFTEVISFFIMSRFKQKGCKFDIKHAHVPAGFPQDIITAHACHKAGIEERARREKNHLSFILKWLKLFYPIPMGIIKYNYRKRNYKKVIAISGRVKEELIKYYNVPEEDVVVIYDGVNTEEFNPENKSLFKKVIRSKYNLLTHDKVALFVANRFKGKGLIYIIQALPLIKFKNLKLLVVGGANIGFYQRLAKKLGVIDKVIFAGHVEDVKKYYAMADLFILPTLYEAFGLVVVEAMATGLPVIISEFAGVSEIITDQKDGLLLKDPTDPKEITAKIEQLLENPDLMEKISKSAREVAEKYSWDVIAEKTMKLYVEVSGSKCGGV